MAVGMHPLQDRPRFVEAVLLTKPSGRLRHEPYASCETETGQHLEGEWETPLEVAIDIEAAVPDPLCSKESPGQHELDQS